MKKLIVLAAALVVIAGAAVAQQTITNRGEVMTVYTLANRPQGNTTITTDKVADYQATLDVENGDVITFTNPKFVVTPLGQANGYTNTVTIAAPGSTRVGDTALLVIDSSATNLLYIADNGTVALSSAFTGGVDDTLSLYAISATKWVETARSNN